MLNAQWNATDIPEKQLTEVNCNLKFIQMIVL